MEDHRLPTKIAKWLFKHGQCNGSAVVSPFPVDGNSGEELSHRARRRLGKRGEEKLIGILGAENHEERRQIRAFLAQQLIRDDDMDTTDESSEFDRLERRSPLHAAFRPRAPVRSGGTTPPRFSRPAFQRQEGSSSATTSSSYTRSDLSSVLQYERTPPLSPSSVYSGQSPSPSSYQHHSRERVRGSHLQSLLCPRPLPLYPSSQQQQFHHSRGYPGAPRNVFTNHLYSPVGAAGSDEEGIFARAYQDPPRRSFTQPARPSVTFGFSEPQSPYMSPRMNMTHQSPYPAYCPSPRPRVVLCEKLGCGSYSVVYRGENTQTGQQVAVKVLHDDERLSPKEVSVLSRLDHEHIVKYIGTTTLGDGRAGILLELMKCSLASVIKESNGLDESKLRVYTRQILSGLEYLHRMNIVHRDVKCGNILLDPNGKAKLADFGLAKKIDYSVAKSCKGTFVYMAPEVLLTEGTYGLAADVWSLGCTVIEMACGKPPWSGFGMMPFYERMRDGCSPPIPPKMSTEAVSFIKLCLTRDPRRRPSAAALLSHPFFQERSLKV
ncbi:mitogen-activated protein kinase kinase kinase 3 [Selaginella moellendorffii]|nr:mitogen-activated protein kinase kinase kinase 3 [Selaginella moellendorffii]|eukprot:XP_002981021.2 mitogen-activated protein kinase kinase kinase 3 [Selaginella moellendorffii]